MVQGERMRRRPFRPGRPHRAPGARTRISLVVRRRLERARHLVEQQHFVEAAEIYGQLARGAYARGRVRPGIHMDLQAGRCYLLGDDVANAKAAAMRAVRRADAFGRPRLSQPLVTKVIHHLEQNGGDAEGFREEIASVLGTVDFQQTSSPQRRSEKRLPGSCPACSAPLHPDEIEWVADDRVTCPYCGTIVLAE